MIRIEPATSAMPPNVPQVPTPTTAPAPAKPSFKGDNPDTAEFESMRAEYQNLSTQTSGILSKLGKAGFLVLTGLIGYKTSKWGLEVIEKQAVKMVNAEKTQKVLSNVSGFAKDKVAVKAKALGLAVLNFGKEKIMPLFRKAIESFKNLKFVNKISNRISDMVENLSQKRFARKSKVAMRRFKRSKFSSFVKNKAAKVWDFSKTMTVKAKESIPNINQIKKAGFEAIAASSGFAAALQGADIAKSVTEEEVE